MERSGDFKLIKPLWYISQHRQSENDMFNQWIYQQPKVTLEKYVCNISSKDEPQNTPELKWELFRTKHANSTQSIFYLRLLNE